MIKEFICIVCPNGCAIRAEYDSDPEKISVQGALCPRGEAYVRQELTSPMRTIATSVLITDADSDLVSVRLSAPIPLEMIPGAMEKIRALKATAPVKAGDVLLEDLMGTGSNVIATRSMEKIR